MTAKNSNQKTFKYKVEESFKDINGNVEIRTTRYKTSNAITEKFGIARCSIYTLIRGKTMFKYPNIKIYKINEPAFIVLDE
tara:strand:+ start:985 stop:1227 length:243 start_codon:yes stop_codon:yes gene_type:complete